MENSHKEDEDETNVSAGSPQLRLERLEGLGVFLLARHLHSTNNYE